jgi:membrane-bound lytic murein transglycosylase F
MVPLKWDDLIPMLYRGEGDIIAANMTITKDRSEKLQFTRHHTTTRQVLVQRKPANWRKMKLHKTEELLIRTQIDLIGKKVHVRKRSSYERRLKNLSDEIGGDISIVAVEGDIETEELIRKVAKAEIDYTVADENIALINQSYYPDIDVKTPLSFPQRIAWAVRPNAENLLIEVNKWLKQMISIEKPTYFVIYNKYYKNKNLFRKRIKSDFFTSRTGRISKYDDLIKRHAQTIHWDWKLLASQIYQESQFNPQEKSWAGAKGLLQLMPKTGKEFGAKDLSNPDQNLKAGTAFLKWMNNYWKEIPHEQEKLKFVLASYNTGPGHVQDARRLAQKHGKDPNRWDDHVSGISTEKITETLLYGRGCKIRLLPGEEPYNYVNEILDRYKQYKNLLLNQTKPFEIFMDVLYNRCCFSRPKE